MQSRCVIDSNLRRHAFKLHEAFMLIARDLRSGPDSFLSIVSLVRKNAFDIRFRNGSRMGKVDKIAYKGGDRKGFQLAAAIIVV